MGEGREHYKLMSFFFILLKTIYNLGKLEI